MKPSGTGGGRHMVISRKLPEIIDLQNLLLPKHVTEVPLFSRIPQMRISNIAVWLPLCVVSFRALTSWLSLPARHKTDRIWRGEDSPTQSFPMSLPHIPFVTCCALRQVISQLDFSLWLTSIQLWWSQVSSRLISASTLERFESSIRFRMSWIATICQQ